MNPRILARYPFLSEAKEYIMREAPPLDKLLLDPLYYDIREKGFSRVLNALEEGRVPAAVLLDDDAIMDEILSYPLARMLVSSLKDPFLVARYSLAEAKSASSNLERESLEFQIGMARDIGIESAFDRKYLPPDIEKKMEDADISDESDVVMDFVDYLKSSSSFNSSDWKMVNRELVHGYIALPGRTMIRLIEEKIRKRLLDELPLPVNRTITIALESMTNEIKLKTEEMKDRFREEDMGEFSAERFPPCVSHLISQIQANINLSHEARFFMASFLFHLGLDMAKVIAIFSQSPDFDPSLAGYQLEHIRGDISGTKYTPPSCGTLKTNGICYKPDGLCRKDWMTHPLTYYRIKGKSVDSSEKTRKTNESSEKTITGAKERI
ncbi:MAG: DNA primase large subunit PriL [Candidatus Thermoplasmatota archaeon]|jgi:DNA primase large subunit|nr:DNA primase large subunit PriL [Candidatus Thermoplasmatota archaeon]MDP7265906.1 DNA primase large subunit PriL [Candidatus Thermoplasmatota archaeon]